MNPTGPAGMKDTKPALPPGSGGRTKPSPGKLLTAMLTACLGVSLLTACSTDPELDGAAAGPLQSRVAAAKQLVAQENFPAALAELEQLDQDVTAAAEQGQMSPQRKTRIEDAISTLKRDLEAALTPTPQPSPTAPAILPPASNDGQKQEEKTKKEANKKEEKKEKEHDKGKD